MKARGMRLDTTAIKPRMSIPREFLLCPMGHPDKFARFVGMSLFMHSSSSARSGGVGILIGRGVRSGHVEARGNMISLDVEIY